MPPAVSGVRGPHISPPAPQYLGLKLRGSTSLQPRTQPASQGLAVLTASPGEGRSCRVLPSRAREPHSGTRCHQPAAHPGSSTRNALSHAHTFLTPAISGQAFLLWEDIHPPQAEAGQAAPLWAPQARAEGTSQPLMASGLEQGPVLLCPLCPKHRAALGAPGVSQPWSRPKPALQAVPPKSPRQGSSKARSVSSPTQRVLQDLARRSAGLRVPGASETPVLTHTGIRPPSCGGVHQRTLRVGLHDVSQ